MRDIREKEREDAGRAETLPRTTAGVRECWNVNRKTRK